ncbi:hypothetical protein DPMN_143710 [Dreissena polymorpha]|uniref:Uncharacterized protein n=1 Tax=Dreissena polymorpha TaxID=45954 RepID=A0A9D4GGV8_DREPO|nr:hypothetical protein DPMN_143710 [Dreissena polymorpha]
MSIDCKPCQDGTGVLGSTLFEGNTRPLSSSAADNRSSREYLPHAQAKPPGQDTKSQADTYRHRLTLIYPPGNTYLRASIFLAILTSGNTSAHVRGPGSKRAWSSHQASASIRLAPHHAAWSRHMNDASRVPLCRGAWHRMSLALQ